MYTSFKINEHGIYRHFRGIENLRRSIESNLSRNPKHSVLDILKTLHELNNIQVFANLDYNLTHKFYWMLVASRDNLKQTASLIQQAVQERNLWAFAYPDDHERKDYHNEVASSYFPVQFTKLFAILKRARIATQSNVMRLRDLVASLAKDTIYEPHLALSALESLLIFLAHNALLTTQNLQIIIQNRTYAKDGMTIYGIPGHDVLPVVSLLQALNYLFVDNQSPEVKQVIFSILTRVERMEDVVPVIKALRTHAAKHVLVLKKLLTASSIEILNLISIYDPAMSDGQRAVFAKRVDNLFPRDLEWCSTDSMPKSGFYALLKADFLNPHVCPANILYMLDSQKLFKHLEAIALLAQANHLTADYCIYVLAAHRPLEKAQCFCWYEDVKDSIPATSKQLFRDIFEVACFRLELFEACADLHRKGLLNDEIMQLIFNNWLFLSDCENFKVTLQQCIGSTDSASLRVCLANPSPNTTAEHWQSPITLMGGTAGVGGSPLVAGLKDANQEVISVIDQSMC